MSDDAPAPKFPKPITVDQRCPACGALGLEVVEQFAVTNPTTASLAGFGLKFSARQMHTWSCSKCRAYGRAHPPKAQAPGDNDSNEDQRRPE